MLEIMLLLLPKVTESYDHDRVAFLSCLQKVINKIKHVHEKTYVNVYVWSDIIGNGVII